MADPRVQQNVYGVCSGCGAVAWELLLDKSDGCLDCDPSAYREEDESDYEVDDGWEDDNDV